MPLWIKVTASVLVAMGGYLWLGINIVGNLATVLDLFQWVPMWMRKAASHQELIYQLGPWFLIILGTVSVFILHFWPHGFVESKWTRSPELAAQQDDPLLLAKQAITYAYDRLRDTEWGTYFRGWKKDQLEDKQIETGCHMLTNSGVPMYGVEPMASLPSVIDTEDIEISMARWHVEFDDSVTLRVRNHPERILFRNVAFKRSDLDALVARESAPDSFVPMPEATRRAYEQLRSARSVWAGVADRFAGSPLGVTREEGTLLYMTSALRTQGTPIYGAHPPSRNRELIDPAEFNRGRFKDSGSSFLYHHEKEPRYVDIAVKERDLREAIEKMLKDSTLAV